MKTNARGFTIVELLIVIVVIAILAAITIVAFNGIQERSRASAVSSALSQAAKKLALYQVDNPDQYPAAAGTNGTNNLTPLGIVNSDTVTYQYSASGNTYCLTATTGTTSYKLSNANTTPVKGGCAGHSQGGQPAITNHVLNPSFEVASGTVNGNPGIAGVVWHPSNGSYAYQTSTWAQTGTRSIEISAPTNGTTDAFAQLPSSWFPPLSADAKISVAAYIRMPQVGSAAQDGRARRIQLVVNTSAGTSAVLQTNAAPNTAGVHLVRGVLTVPNNFTSFSFARLYNGHNDTAVQWDSLTIVAGDYPNLMPADGNSQDWTWNGTPNSSTSTGPAL